MLKLREKRKYIGVITKSFNIIEKNIDNLIVSDISNYTYTGEDIFPSVTVSDGQRVLRDGEHYMLSFENNRNPGQATLTVKGIGNYTGVIIKHFIILPKSVELSTKTQSTTSITVKWKSGVGATGYEVYYATNKNGNYEKIKTGNINEYKKSKLSAGKTYYFKVRPYVTINGEKHFGEYSNIFSTTTKTKTPSISVKKGTGKATISWKKVSGASGYKIYMATSKNGKYTKIKNITKGSTVKYTKSSLKKGKTYYFKVRAYRTVNKKTVYSSYSSKKSVKITKTPTKKTSSKTYTVKKGDNLTRIAKKFKTTVKKLISLNKIKKPNLIRPGIKLKIK